MPDDGSNIIAYAQEVVSDRKNPGRLEILSLIDNRISKMLMSEKHGNSLQAVEALLELKQFIAPILSEQLTILGESVEMSYAHLIPTSESYWSAEHQYLQREQARKTEAVRPEV